MSPRTGNRKKKISSSPRRKETSFSTIQSDSSISTISSFESIEEDIDRRGAKTNRSNRKRRREKGGREEGKKVERIFVRRNRVSSFLFFFCKRQTSSPPPFPLLLLFSLLRLTLSNEWERFAFYRASIQTRSNFARFTTIVPAFRKSIQSSQPCPLPASVGTSPIVTRPLFLRIRGDRESKIRSYSRVIFE